MAHGRVSRGTTLDALALDKPLTRSERQLAKHAFTRDADFDAIVKDVKVLHQIRDMRAIDTKGKWERVLPQGRDAAGMVCVSKRGVRRAAVTPSRSGRQAEQLENFVTKLRRRHFSIVEWPNGDQIHCQLWLANYRLSLTSCKTKCEKQCGGLQCS